MVTDASAVEIARLEGLVETLTEFAAACVETGAGYMSEAEKWEWVARSYEVFCVSHSWMPTISYLLEQYEAAQAFKERQENEIFEKTETVEDFHKPAASKFEE
jgi:hypothetical protein